MNLLDQSVGWLARNIPGSTGVFRQYQLDFCCGGNRVLKDVLAERELDAAPVVARLLALQSEDSDECDWSLVPRNALVHHILTRYHDGHRRQLPELILMARRVEQVHRDNPDCPHGLALHLEVMAEELEDHMRKEELILFPMLQTHASPAHVNAPISVMRHEHDQHGEALQRLRGLAQDFHPPKGACNTWRALYTNLAQLQDDLMQHIHLENNILFADAQVS
jgi:regulator of cell morphogenesis and NO signaling